MFTTFGVFLGFGFEIEGAVCMNKQIKEEVRAKSEQHADPTSFVQLLCPNEN